VVEKVLCKTAVLLENENAERSLMERCTHAPVLRSLPPVELSDGGSGRCEWRGGRCTRAEGVGLAEREARTA